MSTAVPPTGSEPPAPRERLMAFWNARYAAEGYSYGTEPNEFLAQCLLHLQPLPRDGRALPRRCFDGLRAGGLFVFEAYSPEQLAYGTGGPKEIALLQNLADVANDFADCAGATIAHRFSGVRRVVEGPLHTGDGHVVQLVVRKNAP